MKIQLASDLHLEFYGALDGTRVIAAAIAPSADVLVLAGDIGCVRLIDNLRLGLAWASAHFQHVVYVLGNHEFYGSTPSYTTRAIHDLAATWSNVHLLQNQLVTLDGVKFFGGTGWFPLLPDRPDLESRMADFQQIRSFKPFVYDQHRAFEVQLAGCRPDVIVSHHLPTSASVPERFKMSALNAYFVSGFDFEECTAGVKLWLHGHTHDPVDIELGPVRVVANPYGYPFEIPRRFNPARVVEV
jgi:predicted phosphodiesterase